MAGVTFANTDCMSVLEDVRSDHSPLNWVLYQYAQNGASKNSLELFAQGEGAFDELKAKIVQDQVLYGLLRVQTGDALSRRIKFVFITYVGENVTPMKRAKVSTHKLAVRELLKGCAVDVHATNLSELDEDDLAKKLKQAGGANYDGQTQTSAKLQSPTGTTPSPAPRTAPTPKEDVAPAPEAVPEVQQEATPVEEEQQYEQPTQAEEVQEVAAEELVTSEENQEEHYDSAPQYHATEENNQVYENTSEAAPQEGYYEEDPLSGGVSSLEVQDQ